jgi:hypothetical protein
MRNTKRLLTKFFNETPEEEIKEIWDRNITGKSQGPTIEEFLQYLKTRENKELINNERQNMKNEWLIWDILIIGTCVLSALVMFGTVIYLAINS